MSEDNPFNDKTAETNQQVKCHNCGAILRFKPGTSHLKCEYCDAENVIEVKPEVIEEIDFLKFINEQYDQEEKVEVTTVKCTTCGAVTTLKPNVTADNCPYCDTALVVTSGSANKIIKPKSLLPFKIDHKQAAEEFKKWIKGLWFAPNKLKKYAQNERLTGVYIPYWTYDSDTYSTYTGQRGDAYYETETYTTTENGQTVTKTRQVRKIRWTFVSGSVSNSFDDILILASTSLPKKQADKLEPWDLQNLVPYDDRFLAGFKSESYQVDLKQGFEEAKSIMDRVIRESVRQDIGGDEQRILTLNTTYKNITFKHLLLPIWISAYMFKNKVYRFLVNGRTGEVQGERPYSFWKIFFLVVSIIAIGVAIYFVYRHYKH